MDGQPQGRGLVVYVHTLTCVDTSRTLYYMYHFGNRCLTKSVRTKENGVDFVLNFLFGVHPMICFCKVHRFIPKCHAQSSD